MGASKIKSLAKVGFIAFSIIGVLCLHYLTFPALRYHHALYRMLFYVPLILACFWFGLKGAIWVVLSVSILFFPHLLLHWPGVSFELLTNLLEGLLYIIVGSILGLLIEKERKRQKALVESQRLAAVGGALSEIAHDMKTPLVAIGGFTNQVMRKLNAEDPNRGKLEIVIKETQRLENMVKEMLDFGKPLELQRRPTDLNALVTEAVGVANLMAEESGVKLSFEAAGAMPALALDPYRIKQVLLNLLSNAIQASPRGGEVVVRTACKESDAWVAVVDAGNGISAEEEKNIFKPFYSKKLGGTGLGLVIVKRIVEGHGGSITFSRNAVKGTTFNIRFSNKNRVRSR